MRKHGPDALGGPLRGTSSWWHGRSDATAPTDEPARDGIARDETAPDAPMNAAPPPDAPKPRRQRKIRVDLVERVKREIAEGTYDTPDRFHAALDRFLECLGGTR